MLAPRLVTFISHSHKWITREEMWRHTHTIIFTLRRNIAIDRPRCRKVITWRLQIHNKASLHNTFTYTDAQTSKKSSQQHLLALQGHSRTFQHLSETLPWGCGRPAMWGRCLLSFPQQAMHNKQVWGGWTDLMQGLQDIEHSVLQSHPPRTLSVCGLVLLWHFYCLHLETDLMSVCAWMYVCTVIVVPCPAVYDHT